jgi:hypothetical protein
MIIKNIYGPLLFILPKILLDSTIILFIPYTIIIELYGYGSIPINTIFNGMNIHLPAILGFTARYQGFDPSPYVHYTIIYIEVYWW